MSFSLLNALDYDTLSEVFKHLNIEQLIILRSTCHDLKIKTDIHMKGNLRKINLTYNDSNFHTNNIVDYSNICNNIYNIYYIEYMEHVDRIDETPPMKKVDLFQFDRCSIHSLDHFKNNNFEKLDVKTYYIQDKLLLKTCEFEILKLKCENIFVYDFYKPIMDIHTYQREKILHTFGVNDIYRIMDPSCFLDNLQHIKCMEISVPDDWTHIDIGLFKRMPLLRKLFIKCVVDIFGNNDLLLSLSIKSDMFRSRVVKKRELPNIVDFKRLYLKNLTSLHVNCDEIINIKYLKSPLIDLTFELDKPIKNLNNTFVINKLYTNTKHFKNIHNRPNMFNYRINYLYISSYGKMHFKNVFNNCYRVVIEHYHNETDRINNNSFKLSEYTNNPESGLLVNIIIDDSFMNCYKLSIYARKTTYVYIKKNVRDSITLIERNKYVLIFSD